MIKIAILILVVLVLLVVGLVIFAATRPNRFRIARCAVIKAPQARIFALIEDFKSWTQWSPYEGRDPAMTRTYGSATSGQGAVYEWAGDNKTVGAGRMEILRTTPASNIVIKLDFVRPFEAHNTAEFTLQPDGDAILVTWAMSGPSSLMHKLMGLAFDMDKMVGKDFETGLANLKTLAEA